MGYKQRHGSLPKGMGFKADSESDACVKAVEGKKVGDPIKDNTEQKVTDNSNNSNDQDQD